MDHVRTLRPTVPRILVALAAAYAIAFAAVYYLTVLTVPGRQLGDALLRGALDTRSALSGTVDGMLDVVSVASLLGAVAVVAVIALVRLDRVRGLAAVGILVGANLSTLVLKNYLLPRPDLGLDEIAPATLNSLPSGHSTAAFSAVAALVFVLPGRWRLPVASAGAGFAALVAVATISAGWHRAGDAVAAFLLVGLWTTVAAAAVLAHDGGPSEPQDGDLRRPSPRWLGAFALGGVLLGLFVDAGLLASSLASGSTVGAWLALFGGVLLVVGTVCAVTVGTLRTLDLLEGR